jgi:hypothetical protein
MKTKTFDNYYLTDILTDVQTYLETEDAHDKVISIVIARMKERYFATITLKP